ncbi:hypothetical protein EC036_29860 [Enterobacter cloacae]|nr:hypothetical protein EC036_29860 [Enterobacter cloacae]
MARFVTLFFMILPSGQLARNRLFLFAITHNFLSQNGDIPSPVPHVTKQ